MTTPTNPTPTNTTKPHPALHRDTPEECDSCSADEREREPRTEQVVGVDTTLTPPLAAGGGAGGCGPTGASTVDKESPCGTTVASAGGEDKPLRAATNNNLLSNKLIFDLD